MYRRGGNSSGLPKYPWGPLHAPTRGRKIKVHSTLQTINLPSDPSNPSISKFLSWKKKKEMPYVP
jgi:hypothetical protein